MDTLNRKNVIRILSLDQNIKLSRFKLWWNTFVLNKWEVRDLIVTDRSRVMEHKVVFLLLFEKDKRKKEVNIKHYKINLSKEDLNTLHIIEDEVPDKITEILNTFSRKGYRIVTIKVKCHGEVFSYFKKFLKFKYSRERSYIHYQDNNEKIDILYKLLNNE